MDLISVSGRCRLKIICTRNIFTNLYWGEAGYHVHEALETQGLVDLRVDLVDAV